MAVGMEGGITKTFIASGDLSAKQYYFVKQSAANTVVICNGASDVPIGVLQNDPASGEEAVVMLLGITKVSSNEALTLDWFIGTSADGQADRKIAGTDASEFICGRVLSATAAAAGLATCAINCISPTYSVTAN